MCTVTAATRLANGNEDDLLKKPSLFPGASLLTTRRCLKPPAIYHLLLSNHHAAIADL